MGVFTEEQHYEWLKNKPGPIRAYHEKGNPKSQTVYTSGFDFTEGGIQLMLDVRLVDRVDPRTGRLLPWTRTWLREEMESNYKSWERFNNAQVNPKPDMTGKWANRTNYLRAKRRLMEEECRFLHKLLAEKQAEAKTNRESRKPVGCVKLKDGQPHRVDGRDLVETENGEFMLADTGVMLKDYLAEVTAKRKRDVARKQQRDLHACAACK